jgi:hypothetical protein
MVGLRQRKFLEFDENAWIEDEMDLRDGAVAIVA